MECLLAFRITQWVFQNECANFVRTHVGVKQSKVVCGLYCTLFPQILYKLK